MGKAVLTNPITQWKSNWKHLGGTAIRPWRITELRCDEKAAQWNHLAIVIAEARIYCLVWFGDTQQCSGPLNDPYWGLNLRSSACLEALFLAPFCYSFIIVFWFGGHAQRCSGFIPGFVFWDLSWGTLCNTGDGTRVDYVQGKGLSHCPIFSDPFSDFQSLPPVEDTKKEVKLSMQSLSLPDSKLVHQPRNFSRAISSPAAGARGTERNSTRWNSIWVSFSAQLDSTLSFGYFFPFQATS